MKNVYITIAVLSSFLLLQSFHTPEVRNIKHIMKEYRHEKGFMLISLPAFLVRPFIPAEEEAAKQFMNDVKMFRVLIGQPEVDKSVTGNLADDVLHFLDDNHYKQFLTVITPEEKVVIKGVEKNGIIKELVVFVNSTEESIIVQITGNIVLNELVCGASNLVADL